MTKTSSRRTKKASDFKRIKAKVGKRAIKPANVTDTSFRTASLVVPKQHVGVEPQQTTDSHAISEATADDPATIATLYSGKGKSLQELTAQLSHPASNVRISAIKGMNAIVNDFPQVFLSRYYYLLFPAMAKCLVDSDTNARQLSHNLLRDVLRQALLQPSQRLTLRPYIPLLVAYILSALNSLDRPTRLDGAKALIILFDQSNSQAGAETDHDDREETGGELNVNTGGGGLVDEDDIRRLLPALVGLMTMDLHQQQQQQQQQQASLPKSKNSKKSSTMESERCIILQSLVAVLRGVQEVPSSSNQPSRTIQTKFTSSQVKGCSVVLLRRDHNVASVQHPSTQITKLSSIFELPPFDDRPPFGINHQARPVVWGDASITLLPANVLTELVSKLCDHLAETTLAGGSDDLMDQHVSRSNTNNNNNMLGKYAAEELHLVVTAIHLVWRTLGPRGLIEQSYTKTKDDTNVQLQANKKWRQLVSLLLETFPVISQEHQSREDGPSLCERLNLTICTILMDVSSVLMQTDEESETSSWIDPILKYLLPLIERIHDVARHNVSVVHVLASLLLLRHDGDNSHSFLLSPKTCHSILESLQTFLVGENDPQQLDETRIRSPAGRRVAQLVRDLMTESCSLDPFQANGSNEWNTQLLAMLVQMPNVLNAWRGDFPSSSFSILALLNDVVRRIPPQTADASKQQFLQQMRQGLVPLFATTAATAKRKRKSTPDSVDGSRSVFEQYPALAQRQVLGLIHLLESPTPETVTSLGIICARGGMNPESLSPEVEDFAVQVLHGIRKTLSMQVYLGFLVQSTGILNSNMDFSMPGSTKEECKGSSEETQTPRFNKVWTPGDINLLLSFERKIRRTSWYLTDCGNTSKVLPMLHPVLASWLDASVVDKNFKLFTLRARSAVAMLAWLSHDIQTFGDGSSIFAILREFDDIVGTALCRLLNTLPPVGEKEEDDESISLKNGLLRPIVALIHSEPSLLKIVFLKQLNQVRNDTSKDAPSNAALEMLLTLVRDPLTRETLTRFKPDLVEVALSIEKEVAGGPCENASRSLRMYIENAR